MNAATNRPVSALHLEWLENRAIDPEHAIVAMGIYSAKPAKNGEPIPDVSGNILVFPYFDGGVEVNAKYRGPGKKFWQKTGARKTFYNADVLDDPSLAAGTVALVVTEGEADSLVAIQCGHPHSVSCPDGAPADRDAHGKPIPMRPDDELDPANDSKFEYVFNNWARLEPIKRIILATDGDGPGTRLRDELARRLGRVRCLFVEYPADRIVDDDDKSGRKIKRAPKDLNEVRQFIGDDAVREVIRNAKPYPVKGLYRLSQYPELPAIPVFATGWWTLDRHLKLFAGEFMVVTGIPSHGKSSWVLNLVVNLAETHGWRSAVFSPEMPTVPHMRDKLRRIKLRKRPLELEWEATAEADLWINDNLVFIDADPSGRDDEDFDLDWIIARAVDAVLRDGIRVLVIDPWNEIDHARRVGESETEYIGRSIRALKRFGQQYGVAVIVVAHPSKEVAKDGKSRSPTLYDITGCYSDDTEVLTQRGWLHHSQIALSDDVACFDPKTSEVQYHQPSRVIRKEHDGDMVHFRGYGFDLLVTPDHRALIKPDWPEPVGAKNGRGRPVRFEKDKWHFVEAAKVPRAAFVMPLGGNPILGGAEPKSITIGARSYPADAFWRLVGWYVAEGAALQTGLSWSQARGEIAEAFSSSFAEAGIPTSFQWREPSGKGKQVVGCWYIGNRFCPELVSWFKNNCGIGALHKCIPSAVFELSPRLKHVFLKAYLEGDGSRTRYGFRAVTISPRLRDDLQRLAVELGIATSCLRRMPRELHHYVSYQIEFGQESRREVMLLGRNASVEKYSGLVWCLTVPTGAYFVRRKGRVCVSGNSAHFYNKCDHGIIIDRPDPNLDESTVRIAKVRFDETGDKGQVRLRFDRESSRFEILDGSTSDPIEGLT